MTKDKSASRSEKDRGARPSLPSGASEAVGNLRRLQAISGIGSAPPRAGTGAALGLGGFLDTLQAVESLYGLISPGSRLGLARLFAAIAPVDDLVASLPGSGRRELLDPGVLQSLAEGPLADVVTQGESGKRSAD